jgi:cell division protein FtsN
MTQVTTRQRGRGGPGRAQWLVLGGGLTVALLLTFALGVLVGRQWARHPAPALEAAAEPARKPAPAPRRGGLSEPAVERPAQQEKLTFYQTLTAPLSAQPASTKTEMAPRAEAAKPRAEPAPAAAPAPAPADKAVTAPRAPAGPAPAVPAPTARAAAAEHRGDWAVQVGAFKDRGQAESVRKPLSAAGFDAYLLDAPGEGAQPRYKVRLGTFKTRGEAARMAERIRQERSLTAFVTSR